MLCHSRRLLSRGHPRGLVARLYRLWSREAIRRIFRYCFHLVNSRRCRHESWRYSRISFSMASTVTSFRQLLRPVRASSRDASSLDFCYRCLPNPQIPYAIKRLPHVRGSAIFGFPRIGRCLVRAQNFFAHDYDHVSAHADKIDRFRRLRLIADLARLESFDDVFPVDYPVDRRVDQNIGSHQGLDPWDVYRPHHLAKTFSCSERRNDAWIARGWLIDGRRWCIWHWNLPQTLNLSSCASGCRRG